MLLFLLHASFLPRVWNHDGKAAERACAVRETGQCPADPINRESLQGQGALHEVRLGGESNGWFGENSLGIRLPAQQKANAFLWKRAYANSGFEFAQRPRLRTALVWWAPNCAFASPYALDPTYRRCVRTVDLIGPSLAATTLVSPVRVVTI
jgi:hypothetical protein